MMLTILGVIGALVIGVLAFAGAICWLQHEEEKITEYVEEEKRRDNGGTDL